MGILKAIFEAVFPFRRQIIFRAFQGVTQFLIAVIMSGIGWTSGHFIVRIFVFSLFDGWEKFLPEVTESITSDVLLSWFSSYGLDAIGKFLGMWFCFNHANYHMYNYLYLIKLKGMYNRKFWHFLQEYPQFAEWAYTTIDAVYVVAYLVLDFIIPFFVMLITIYVAASIGSSIAYVAVSQWLGAAILPFVAFGIHSYTQSLVRAGFHYNRLESEVGENFDPSRW